MSTINTGNQGWNILEGYFLDNGSLTGQIMPNIEMISPEAIVPDGTNITINRLSNITPTGGVNGDIWYNEPEDKLYKNISGIWSLLTDRVINSFFQGTIVNTTACPVDGSNYNTYIENEGHSFASSALACAASTGGPSLYSDNTSIEVYIGKAFFTDSLLTTPFVGDGTWYSIYFAALNIKTSAQINSSGIVTSTTSC